MKTSAEYRQKVVSNKRKRPVTVPEMTTVVNEVTHGVRCYYRRKRVKVRPSRSDSGQETIIKNH